MVTPVGRRHGLGVHESIAAGAIGAIAIWAVVTVVGGADQVMPLPDWAWWPAWLRQPTWADVPLVIALAVGGGVLLAGLARDILGGTFGADLLAGISIVTSLLLGEYLAGVLVVIMLSGGEALEARAVARAGDVLEALARRMPTVAHRRVSGGLADVALADVAPGDVLVVLPHEICPVDGVVEAGRGSMDESYLTGEPYRMGKAPGSVVLSGAINGESALDVRTERVGADSRYSKIMQVLAASRQTRPRMRRLADTLGGLYTPLALAVAAAAGWWSGSAGRFLAVLVVATPCPLLIAIPVAIIGAVSLAAKRGIVIRDPAILERLDSCRIAIFDKTGTLTYGRPAVTEVVSTGRLSAEELVRLAASLEAYSKHPLAAAVVDEGRRRSLSPLEVEAVSERPGEGLVGRVVQPDGRRIEVVITGRRHVERTHADAGPHDREAPASVASLPRSTGGLECVVLADGSVAGLMRFRDTPRPDGRTFVSHLGPSHRLERVMLVSGDRETEVRWLAEAVGITEVHAEIQPEGKLSLVQRAMADGPTLFVGDGINDCPALAAATVGVALGTASDVTSEAAGAVVMDSTLERVDELLHIGRRFRRIALASAVGGMAASLAGMGIAACGWLPPAAGALVQEGIDLAAVANALRVTWRVGRLSDYRGSVGDRAQAGTKR